MSNVYWEWHIPWDQQTIAAGSCGSSGSSKSTRRDLSPIVETWRLKKWESPGFNRDISWTVWTIWIYSNLDMGIAWDSPYFFTEWTFPCKCGPDSIDRHAFPQSCNKQAPDSDQICRFFQCGRVRFCGAQPVKSPQFETYLGVFVGGSELVKTRLWTSSERHLITCCGLIIPTAQGVL
jgi:hypothetical protein